MRDIFYNQTNEIGSHDWLIRLTEAEQSEWSWIQNNIEKVNKLTDEFGLKEFYYLGRVLYVLSFTGSEDASYTKEDYTQGYAKYENQLETDQDQEVSLAMLKSMNVLYSLLNQPHLPEAMDWDRNKISSQIQAYQRVLDLSTKRLDIIKSYHPDRYDYRTAVFRRIDFLFFQMKLEGIQAKISIRNIYHLYHLYKFADYYEDRSFGNNSPLFKRIQTHRNQALKHFKHRFTKHYSQIVENSTV